MTSLVMAENLWKAFTQSLSSISQGQDDTVSSSSMESNFTPSPIVNEIEAEPEQNTSFELYNDTLSEEENNLFLVHTTLPQEFTEISETSKHCVIAYCILFVLASTGNLTVLFSLWRQYSKRKSRITLLIMHLSVADLIVCCCLMPIEIFWRLTIQWYGGNVMCKVCQFLRAFGLYLSSTVLICIGFDRYYAVRDTFFDACTFIVVEV